MRGLLHSVTIASTLVFLTSVLMWVRSHHAPERWAKATETRLYTLTSAGGRFCFYSGGWSKLAGGPRPLHRNPTSGFHFDPADSWEFGGFGYGRMLYAGPTTWAVAVPYWLICVSSALMPSYALIQW